MLYLLKNTGVLDILTPVTKCKKGQARFSLWTKVFLILFTFYAGLSVNAQLKRIS